MTMPRDTNPSNTQPSEGLTKEQYLERFKYSWSKRTDEAENAEARKKTFDCAFEIRKFEIELYWKRAAYFWTFIGATFAGYGLLQSAGSLNEQKRAYLSVLLSCLGFVFSVGWFLVNKGSKKWQTNWEKNVELLENEIVGPLFSTVWDDKQEKTMSWNGMKKFIAGPSRFSGSKINQIISLFVAVLWGILLLGSSVEAFIQKDSPSCLYFFLAVSAIVAAVLACHFFNRYGKSDDKKDKSFWFENSSSKNQANDGSTTSEKSE